MANDSLLGRLKTSPPVAPLLTFGEACPEGLGEVYVQAGQKVSLHHSKRPVPLLTKESLGEVPSRIYDKKRGLLQIY